jgi:hypothetical protein
MVGGMAGEAVFLFGQIRVGQCGCGNNGSSQQGKEDALHRVVLWKYELEFFNAIVGGVVDRVGLRLWC